jgi:UDP-N-acetylglucosamine 2-epimerase (non-hydrolysing)
VADRIKISAIFGTRPEAIKFAPVIKALRADPSFLCHVCVTAQHRAMLDQILEVFDVVPDTDLNLMAPNQRLCDLAARSLKALDAYLVEEKPDLVLVQGDTTTAFVGALAAFYNNIPVGHVEAGLRTGNLRSPWPEEANRVLTSRLTTLHFAPTEISRQNLLQEGIPPERVVVTGNTVIDALFLALRKVRNMTITIPGIPSQLVYGRERPPLVLITGHRRESIGLKLEAICAAVRDLAVGLPAVHFIYPVHLNPSVRSTVFRILGSRPGETLHNVHLIEPLPYLEFVAMMERSTVILTDSGGIQEEAPSLGKPVLVTRDTTERPEAIAAGTAKLVGTDPKTIMRELRRLLTDTEYYKSMSTAHNPYGDGNAAHRILQAIRRHCSLSSGVQDMASEDERIELLRNSSTTS